jgi:excinuclease ABC subunit C
LKVKPICFEVSNVISLKIVPRLPGVYLFKDLKSMVLYVGKAKDLRQRLANYFRPDSFISTKTDLILKLSNSFEIIVTSTEKEALILEASLIRKYKPKYNVMLRDDKAYPFLKLDIKKRFPRLSVVRKRAEDEALYFGPYPSARAVKETLKSFSFLFGLRTCSDRFMNSRTRACLLHQIKRCSAPCIGAITEKDYSDRVRQIKLILEGKSSSLLKILKTQMEEASEALDFEKAAVLRDQIYSIKKIGEKQSIVTNIKANWDIIGLARSANVAILTVLKVRDGVVQTQEIQYLSNADEETDQEILSIFISQFYQKSPVPKEIILPEKIEDSGPILEWLADQEGKTIWLKRPIRGLKFKLLEMAKANAEQALLSFERQNDVWQKKAFIIKDVLNLKFIPKKVEGIDISITGDELPVGSLVTFYKGQPNKKDYRHYNIKEVTGTNDYAMIKEVMWRRLTRGRNMQDLPDLFLVDGGRGQLKKALEAVGSAGLGGKFDILALAKEIEDEGEKIFSPQWSGPLTLPRNHPALLFLQQVRDEAHRFGINFHRKKRNTKRLYSRLNEIPGIGPKRRQALLKHFGSLKRVNLASWEEINKVPGISEALAKTIQKHLNSE